MYRLMSRAAAVLPAFGLAADWFQRWRDYRGTLNELESLSARDLQDMRINKPDFITIAWEEARRRQRSRTDKKSKCNQDR